MRKYGIQYVAGGPPRTPVLRPIRQSMYDREPVSGPYRKSIFFVDCMKTQDGRSKDKTFTNMTQNGQLGLPLEFDMFSIGLYPVAANEEYLEAFHLFMHSSAVLEWYFGASTRWLQQAISTMPSRAPGNYYVADEKTGLLYRVTVRDGKLTAVPIENWYKEWETTKFLFDPMLKSRIPSKFVNMTTPDKKPRHIHSNESFRADIETSENIGPEFDLYVAMEGVLYAQVL